MYCDIIYWHQINFECWPPRLLPNYKFWKYIDLNAKATNSTEEIRSNLTDRPILGERLSSSWRRPRCLGRRGLRAILLWSELWKRGLGKRLPPTLILLHGTLLTCTSHGTLCVARIMPRLPPKNYSDQYTCNPVANAVFQCTLQLHHLVKQLHLASCPVPTYWSLDRIKF